MSEFDIILDSSRQNLKAVPQRILEMGNLKMLYLQKNYLTQLPNDFFLRLNQLSWLDLRYNMLLSIPVSIAHHQCLEHLLLSDNKIEVLPNELGLVPKLKVLQIANNPLIYPSSKIIAQGAKSVIAFLKSQYEKSVGPPSESDQQLLAQEEMEVQDEKEIRNVEDFGDVTVTNSVSSSLIVKGLSKEKNDDKIVHKISKEPSKILVQSYYNEDKYVRASTQTSNYSILTGEDLKESWMEKLKKLLEQQEKILQQERNLQALSSWRNQKITRTVELPYQEALKPPYGTYPEYNSILSREDLTKQIDKYIEKNKNPPKKENIEKLINDLIGQLKDMETSYGGIKSPRSEIEAAGNQIVKILEVHKKLLKLRKANTLL